MRGARVVTAAASERYILSFTVGGLYLQNASLVARLYRDLGDWSAVRRELDSSNLLQARTVSSAKRHGQEVVQRLQHLSDAELEILTEATADERAQLMWVAACRRYALIAEFAEEVLRERFLLMAPDVTSEHFDAFVRGKTLWHPELTGLEESTLRRLRSNLFLMMREGDFVTEQGLIAPTVLSSRVRDELARRVPADIRFFATREAA